MASTNPSLSQLLAPQDSATILSTAQPPQTVVTSHQPTLAALEPSPSAEQSPQPQPDTSHPDQQVDGSLPQNSANESPNTASGLNPGLFRSSMLSMITNFIQTTFSAANSTTPSTSLNNPKRDPTNPTIAPYDVESIDLVKMLLFLEKKGCYAAEIAECLARVLPHHFVTPLTIRAATRGFVLSQYVYCYLLRLQQKRQEFAKAQKAHLDMTAMGDELPIDLSQEELEHVEQSLRHLQQQTDVVFIHPQGSLDRSHEEYSKSVHHVKKMHVSLALLTVASVGASLWGLYRSFSAPSSSSTWPLNNEPHGENNSTSTGSTAIIAHDYPLHSISAMAATPAPQTTYVTGNVVVVQTLIAALEQLQSSIRQMSELTSSVDSLGSEMIQIKNQLATLQNNQQILIDKDGLDSQHHNHSQEARVMSILEAINDLDATITHFLHAQQEQQQRQNASSANDSDGENDESHVLRQSPSQSSHVSSSSSYFASRSAPTPDEQKSQDLLNSAVDSALSLLTQFAEPQQEEVQQEEVQAEPQNEELPDEPSTNEPTVEPTINEETHQAQLPTSDIKITSNEIDNSPLAIAPVTQNSESSLITPPNPTDAPMEITTTTTSTPPTSVISPKPVEPISNSAASQATLDAIAGLSHLFPDANNTNDTAKPDQQVSTSEPSITAQNDENNEEAPPPLEAPPLTCPCVDSRALFFTQLNKAICTAQSLTLPPSAYIFTPSSQHDSEQQPQDQPDPPSLEQQKERLTLLRAISMYLRNASRPQSNYSTHHISMRNAQLSKVFNSPLRALMECAGFEFNWNTCDVELRCNCTTVVPAIRDITIPHHLLAPGCSCEVCGNASKFAESVTNGNFCSTNPVNQDCICGTAFRIEQTMDQINSLIRTIREQPGL